MLTGAMECLTYRELIGGNKKSAGKKTPPEQDAVTFARERLGFEADEQQMRMLRSTAKQGILNCTRQWGKSTTAAVKAVHRAYTQPECLVLVASPSERQSAGLVRKAAGMVRKLKIRPRGDGDNPISLLFPNESRIVGVPGKEGTVRGYSAVSLMLIDEAARVEEEMYRALTPMLAVGNGDLWIMSTPCGKRGFFYEAWEYGGADWERVMVRATECPRIPATFLDRERKRLGPYSFRQEYMAEFVENEMGLFDRDVVEKALDGAVKPLNLGIRCTWD